MEKCLFCNEIEVGHPITAEYVCGTCVQRLLAVSEERLKGLWAKAKAKNNKRILKALRILFGKRAESLCVDPGTALKFYAGNRIVISRQK